jgi:hypothetical protein
MAVDLSTLSQKSRESALLVITKKGSDGFPIQDRVAGLNFRRRCIEPDGRLRSGRVRDKDAPCSWYRPREGRESPIAADLAPSVNSFLANLV